MRHEDCIFADEEDCPKDKIKITCSECLRDKSYETIERAVRDFTALGEAYTEIFVLLKKLIDHDGKTVSIVTPVDSAVVVNKVMTAILTKDPALTREDAVYRRLIFCFFGILVDQFNEEEYVEDTYLH